MYALRLSPGDEVIVPAITFAASANCVTYQGGTPVFADVDARHAADRPGRGRGQDQRAGPGPLSPWIMPASPATTTGCGPSPAAHGLALVDDACHPIGGSYKGRPVGSLADLNAFSFHPVKHVTTGEGGAVATDDPSPGPADAACSATTASAPISASGETAGSWVYEMVDLGYNYRLTDIQCALGLSQLAKLPRRSPGDRPLRPATTRPSPALPGVRRLPVRGGCSHAYHLYVMRLELEAARRIAARSSGACGPKGSA